MTTDHTREALIQWFEQNHLPAVTGGDPDEVGMIWGSYDTARATALADAILASSWLAAHVDAVVADERDWHRHEVERLKDAINTLEGAWSVCDDERQAAWAKLNSLVREREVAPDPDRLALQDWIIGKGWPNAYDQAHAILEPEWLAGHGRHDRVAALRSAAGAAKRRGNSAEVWKWLNDRADSLAARIARSTTDGGDTDD